MNWYIVWTKLLMIHRYSKLILRVAIELMYEACDKVILISIIYAMHNNCEHMALKTGRMAQAWTGFTPCPEPDLTS